MTDLDHSTRYDLMTTDQASPSEIAAWLKDPGFAAYVEGRNASMAARQASVNAPAHSADAVIAAGSAMANILYNLKQTTIGDERLRASMKKCQEDWDKARSLATIPAAEPVAWRIQERNPVPGSEYLWRFATHPSTFGEAGEPLYASPQPARETKLVEALNRIVAVMPGDPATDTLTSATGRLNAVIHIAGAALRAGEQP